MGPVPRTHWNTSPWAPPLPEGLWVIKGGWGEGIIFSRAETNDELSLLWQTNSHPCSGQSLLDPVGHTQKADGKAGGSLLSRRAPAQDGQGWGKSRDKQYEIRKLYETVKHYNKMQHRFGRR